MSDPKYKGYSWPYKPSESILRWGCYASFSKITQQELIFERRIPKFGSFPPVFLRAGFQKLLSIG